MTSIYKVRREIRPWNLDGISENQIAQHWALYEGDIRNTSAIVEKLAALAKAENYGPEFAALKRQWSHEVNGALLHESYFEVLKRGAAAPGEGAEIVKRIKAFFGGFAAWKKEFAAVGAIRGAGWAILYLDAKTGALTNAGIVSHEDGHPAGFAPLLAMDVWEHAYMVDWGASGRAHYIEAFFENVDWAKVEGRLQSALSVYASENINRR